MPAPSNPVRVTDIYRGDNVTSFATAKANGLIGVIHKATTGRTGKDPMYKRRRTAAQAAGLLWGAYHWGTAVDVDRQIDNFLGWAEPDDSTLVALDYEKTSGNQMTLNQARDFLHKLAQRLGRKPVLYCGGLLKDQLGHTHDAFLGSHRLWLAHYSATPVPQASWNNYWLWQYTDGGSNGPAPKTVPGIPGNSAGRLDCDHYDGTAARLAQDWAS